MAGGTKSSTRGRRKGNRSSPMKYVVTESEATGCDGKVDRCQEIQNLSNVNKSQRKVSKIPIVNKRAKQASMDSPNLPSKRRKGLKEAVNAITANFDEDGDGVQFQITPNEDQEFASEAEDESGTEMETGDDAPTEKGSDYQGFNDNESEVVILRRTQEEIEQAEEKEMLKFVNFMCKQGLVMVQASPSQPQSQTDGASMANVSKVGPSTPKIKGRGKSTQSRDDNSVVTIYENAVQRSLGSKRESSSSEEQMDTSDEMQSPRGDVSNLPANQFVSQYVAEYTAERIPAREDPQLHCSRFEPVQQEVIHGKEQEIQPTTMRMTEEELRRSEQGKARIYSIPGKNYTPEKEKIQSVLVDEDYLVVGSHIDQAMKLKIAAGEYVDFTKLMPKDKVVNEEDVRIEMVNRGGMSYWVPLSDRESTAISSYTKWEQAFRVFNNVYMSFHPNKAVEMIQYNHIIHTASLSFAWENVYKYDREFRLPMSKHHMKRNWSVILQQAWAIYLKDKVNSSVSQNNPNYNTKPRRRLCFDFNSGNCTYGKRCKFDHRCSFCNKYGHGSYNCRKAHKSNTTNNNNSGNHGYKGKQNDNQHRWEKYEKEHVSGSGNKS